MEFSKELYTEEFLLNEFGNCKNGINDIDEPCFVVDITGQKEKAKKLLRAEFAKPEEKEEATATVLTVSDTYTGKCQCRLCGAGLSNEESIARGFGSECLASINKAKAKVFLSNKSNSLKYNWLIEVDIVKTAYLERYANTRFRSPFRKSFFETISTTERVSKKQLEIIYSMIDENLSKKIIESKREFLTTGIENIRVSRNLIEIARREIKNK